MQPVTSTAEVEPAAAGGQAERPICCPYFHQAVELIGCQRLSGWRRLLAPEHHVSGREEHERAENAHGRRQCVSVLHDISRQLPFQSLPDVSAISCIAGTA